MNYRFILAVLITILFLHTGCKKDSPKVTETPVVPPADVILDRPINLNASKGAFGDKIVISWTKVPLAKKYQVYKFSDTENQYKLLTETADTAATDFVGTPLVKVFYKVKIYNSATEYSPFSDVNFGYTSGKTYSKLLSFGSQGSGLGQFQFPMHVEVDSLSNIYVSDDNRYNVQKFDIAGNYTQLFYSGPSPRGIAFLSNGNTVVTNASGLAYVTLLDKDRNILKTWGAYGTGDAQFQNVEEITVDNEQNIYVVDGQNNNVKKYDKNGNFLLKFTAAIQTDRQIDGPYPFGVTYFKDKIFVTSPRNSVIRIYDKVGNFIKSWDAGAPCYAIKGKGDNLFIAMPGYVLKTDENGELREKIGEGDFLTTTVTGLAITNNGEVVASDVYARKIFVFKHL
nr:NHL repeat-containing protein [uncultured Mucilaginibacter sp.]